MDIKNIETLKKVYLGSLGIKKEESKKKKKLDLSTLEIYVS
jgi:hypothetical protein